MTLVDVKAIEQQAKKEIAEETSKAAVNKLKELYRHREKAALVVKNLDREIDGYLAEVSEATIYESAGVDTTKK
jgi:hypothetical protein